MTSYTNHLEEKKVRVEKLKEDIEKNEKLLIKKKEELKKLNLHSLDGPSRRTRSQGRDNRNPTIEKLEKEIEKLTKSIDSMKFTLKILTYRPDYLKNY